MKKAFIMILTLIMLLASLPVGATTLEVDGTKVDSPMIFTDSTVYVPLSSIASSLNMRISTDKNTDSVFVNGINLFAVKKASLTIYINGKEYIPSDTAMKPIVQNGEVYLPAHLAAEAFGKEAVWYDNTATLTLSTPALPVVPTVIDENTTYVIVNRGTGKVLSSEGNSLTTEEFSKSDNQKFRIVKTEFDGYYHIQSSVTGYNLDVNSHGTTPGVSIITWEMGTGDNQKFMIEDAPGGAIIAARSCHLPIEPNKNGVIQNTRDDNSLNQKWSVVPFDSYVKPVAPVAEKLIVNYTPTEESKEETAEMPYRTFTIDDKALSDSASLSMTLADGSDAQKWTLTTVADGIYVITNLSSQKSLDVSARSLVAGGSIITWQTSSDSNQRWILEQNGDGTYYIKSVHSALYLTVTDSGNLIQEAKNTSLKQRWTVTGVN